MLEKNCSHKYDDIINMERPVSKKHPPMSGEARAAQFASFAALTGYDEEIRETADHHERDFEYSAGYELIDDYGGV